MYVVHGAVPDVDQDRAVTARVASLADETGESVIRAWVPPRHLAFGRRDTAREGYTGAREIADTHGYEPVTRRVGGHAVAYTGDMVAFVYGVPTETATSKIHDRYAYVQTQVKHALEATGAGVACGEPDAAFCPGEYSLQAEGKIVGMAQRVTRGTVLVGGCIVVRERDEAVLADVLAPIYGALDIPFRPEAVGSLEAAGGPTTPGAVVETLTATFTTGRSTTAYAASRWVE